MPTYTQANRAVRIDTPFGPDVLLLKNFRGTESLGRPFQYDLVLVSEDPELDYEKIIGQKVTITVETTGQAADGSAVPRYFHGFISRFAQANYEGKLAEYHATVVPWLWFLTRSADCRIFQNQNVPDILTQVFKDFGFSDVISQLHGNYRTRSYCVQYRETAFHFVSRLMEEEGIYYFFKHERGKHSIVLCDSPASHEEFPGYGELLYRPSSEGVQETLRSWSVQHEVQSDAYATTNFNFTAPNAYAVSSSFESRGYGPVKLEQFDYLGEQSEFDQYSTGATNENDRYSLMRLQELQARFETYTGESDARGVATGVKFTLKGHPRRAFEQVYLTTGADYQVSGNPFESADEYGQEFKFEVRLTAMLLTVPFRSPRVTPKPIVHGPQTATVVGPAGEKISTDEYGQVKVQFHWDRLGQNDQNSSCYMRVSQGWAGNGWGDMAIPHVGDEVIVECLEGDPDRPIITGRVYNEAQMPPLDLPANKAQRIWQDDYGNRLVFDATPGDEHIRLFSPHHQSGLTLGRSSAVFTQSDDIKGVVGTQLTGVFGANVAHTFGLNLATTVGSNMAFNIGGNYTGNLATQCTVNLGPQFTYTKGIDLSVADSDFSKVVKGNALISSDKDLSLVGGAGMDPPAPPTSAVMFAGESGIELSAGEGKATSSAAPTNTHTGLAITAMVVPVVASLFMACTSSFVDAYTDKDSTDSQKNTAFTGQQAMQGTAGGLQAASLVCLIATLFMGKKDATTTPVLARHTNDWYSRMQVLTVADSGYQARLQTKEGGILLSHEAHVPLPKPLPAVLTPRVPNPGVTSNLALTDAGITAEVGIGGKILIKTAAGSVEVDAAGVVTIGGTKVSVTAADIDLGGGAVTILGVPMPPKPPALVPAVTQIKAQDVATTAKTKVQLIADAINRSAQFPGTVLP